MEAGKRFGLRSKIHVNQFTAISGIAACVKHNALSVDHLEIVTDEDIEVLKNSEIDLKNIKQTEMFLKLAQREDGAVLTALLKENEIIKSEEMLYAILAFVKSGHYQEAKEAIEYIIKSKILN